MRSLITAFIPIILLFYFGNSKIKEIDCQINQTPCSEETEQEFGKFLGQNFFLVKTDEKVREMKASYPHWEKIVIKKTPFHKILISITTRQPVACLLIGDKIFLLDKEAVVLNERKTNPGLPEIEVEKFKEEEVKRAIEAIFLLNQYSVPCGRMKIENQQLTLLWPETIVLLPQKELSLKIASLQMIVSQGKIEDKLPKIIDLRFKKPVISY